MNGRPTVTIWRLMSRTLLAVMAFAGPASAADVDATSLAHDWSGPYLGLTGNYSFGSANGDTRCCADDFNVDGFQLGGVAGYNFTFDKLLAGLEVDAGMLDIDGVGFGGGVDDFDVSAIARLRARFGVPIDNLLLFVATGLSLGDASADVVGSGSRSNWHLGWNAGAGVDYAISQRIILRAEYIYDGMAAETYRYASNTVDFKWTASTVRLGALIKF